MPPDLRTLGFADFITLIFDHRAYMGADAELMREDKSIGASIRRLRVQKNVRRDDFHGTSATTIARIERKEIVTPYEHTLVAIASRLEVKESDLSSY